MPAPTGASPIDIRNLAKRRANDIVEAIGDIEIPDGTHAACSVGVAIADNRDQSFYDLLEVADQALYASKTAGKATTTIRDM